MSPKKSLPFRFSLLLILLDRTILVIFSKDIYNASNYADCHLLKPLRLFRDNLHSVLSDIPNLYSPCV